MKKIACIIAVSLFVLSLTAPVFAASKLVLDEELIRAHAPKALIMTNAQFVKYVRGTLLKGVAIKSIKLVPTNNAKVVAATAEEPGYPGKTHLYIYSRLLKSPGAAPTPILQKTYNGYTTLQSVVFDDTGKIAIVTEGSIYSSSGTIYIYGANKGDLLTKLYVPSTRQGSITIRDNPGSRLTITFYAPDTMGFQIIYNVTTSRVSIVSRNDHYVPKDVLDKCPTTVSNNNIRIYTSNDTISSSIRSGSYSFFKKDGTYLMSATKYDILSSRGGWCVKSLGSPDASTDGKYIAIAYYEEHYETGRPKEQNLRIFDTTSGKELNKISLLSADQDPVESIKFVKGLDLIEVNYAKAGLVVYDIKTGKPQITDEQFVKYIRNTLLKGVEIQSIELVPTNNYGVVTAIVDEPGCPGRTHVYIYSRILASPGAAPTPILQKTSDGYTTLQSVVFDSTGNIAIVTEGSIYHSYGTLYIYGANTGNLITKLYVSSTSPSAITITDNPGPKLTITSYSPDTMGFQIVYNVTASGVSIVSRNDYYVPKDVLDKCPTTVSNNNIRIYTTSGDVYSSCQSGSYDFFKKDGTYLMSATRYSVFSTRGGWCVKSINSPDASADGKYIAIAYTELHYDTGRVTEQHLSIYDIKTGKEIEDINLLLLSQDAVKSIKFVRGSSTSIEVNYTKAGVKVYNFSPEKAQSNEIQLNENIQKLNALTLKNQSLPNNIAMDPNMAGNDSVTANMVKK